MVDVMKTRSLHETMIKIGAYVLSEFGYLLADQEGKTMRDQLMLLDFHFYLSSNQTKAIMLTNYMKMIKLDDSLKHDVRPILSQYKDHWDEDLQQRSCEYLFMLDQSEMSESTKELVDNALDGMPNFSEDLQTNNVLTRRILQMKVDKGFSMSKEEAQKNMVQNMNAFKTNVSKNLVSNKIKKDDQLAGIQIDDDKIGKFKTFVPKKMGAQMEEDYDQIQQNSGNLLDLDDSMLGGAS